MNRDRIARRTMVERQHTRGSRFETGCGVGESGLTEAEINIRRIFAAPVAVIVAHPDDETVGAGAHLARTRESELGPTIIHVTDGAPRNMSDALAAGFTTREDYARARRRELLAALNLAGIGAEQTRGIGLIGESLVRAGHQSLVVACEGSLVAGELIAVPQTRGVIDEAERKRIYDYQRAAIRRALEQHRVDVVHPRTFLHCVSETQRRSCPPVSGPLPAIPNGVPVERFRSLPTIDRGRRVKNGW